MLNSRLLESRSTTITLLTAARGVLAKRRSEMFEEQCDRSKELLSVLCLKPFGTYCRIGEKFWCRVVSEWPGEVHVFALYDVG